MNYEFEKKIPQKRDMCVLVHCFFDFASFEYSYIFLKKKVCHDFPCCVHLSCLNPSNCILWVGFLHFTRNTGNAEGLERTWRAFEDAPGGYNSPFDKLTKQATRHQYIINITPNRNRILKPRCTQRNAGLSIGYPQVTVPHSHWSTPASQRHYGGAGRKDTPLFEGRKR